MNNYKKLANEGDSIAVKHILQFLKEYDIQFTLLLPINDFSDFDILLDIDNFGKILIENKNRKTYYNNLMLQDDKLKKLIKFKNDNEEIIDIWYLNTFVDNTYMLYSLVQVNNIKPLFLDKTLSLKDTSRFEEDLLKCYIMAPKNTAYNGNYVKKLAYFLPKKLQLNLELYNFDTKKGGLF